MPFLLSIEPSAHKDIEKAYDYYLDKGLHVADLFYDDLQHAYHVLAINPFYQFRTTNYRALPLKSFPFLIFFQVDERQQKVKILALFNTHQDTSKYPQ